MGVAGIRYLFGCDAYLVLEALSYIPMQIYWCTKLVGSWEEKSPTGCCSSAAYPVDRRFFTICGSSNSSTSRKHANNRGSSSCCNPYNFFGWWQAEGHSIWLLLAGHSIQTKWSSSHGEETVELDRADREDGEAKPEENSEGCSAFQERRPEAHPDVHAMSWWQSSVLAWFPIVHSFLSRSPNQLVSFAWSG